MRYQIWYSGDFAKRVSFEICGHGYPIFRSNKIHIDCQHGWFSKLGIPSLNPWKPRLISIFWQMTFSILQYICIDLSDVLLIWNMSLTFLVTQVGPDTVSKRLKRFTVPVSTFLLWKIFKKKYLGKVFVHFHDHYMKAPDALCQTLQGSERTIKYQ